jgi:NitT/TauT family transport system substrate-binding protein
MHQKRDLDEVVITAPAFTMTAAPHWAALDKGFFREEGLDVTLEYTLGQAAKWGGDLFPGKTVFHAPGGGIVFIAFRGGRDDVVNVIATQDKAPHVLVARPEITSIAELKGKRIIAGVRGASYIDARYTLRHFGLDPDKDIGAWVASEDKPPDTERSRIECLKSGEVDAVCSGAPHWYMAVKMGFRRLPSARDLASWAMGGLATTKKVVAERPDVVKRMIRALIKGTEFVRLNKEETLDIVGRNCLYVDRDTISGCYDAIRDQYYVTAEEALYEKAAEVFSKEFGLPRRPIETYYDLRFVKEALTELRLAEPRLSQSRPL